VTHSLFLISYLRRLGWTFKAWEVIKKYDLTRVELKQKRDPPSNWPYITFFWSNEQSLFGVLPTAVFSIKKKVHPNMYISLTSLSFTAFALCFGPVIFVLLLQVRGSWPNERKSRLKRNRIYQTFRLTAKVEI